jgi:GTPase SAR1 family protein
MQGGDPNKASSKARDRGVSFEETFHAKRTSSKARHDVASGRQVDRSRPSEPANFIRLDLAGKVKKNFHLQKQHEGKLLFDLSLRSNHLTKFATNESGTAIHVTVYPADSIEVKVGFSKLLELDLSQNRLSTFLSTTILACMPKLKKLWMNGNQITALPADSLIMLSKHGQIDELNLGTNLLEQLPPEIGLLVTLRKLTLSNNKLVALPPEIVRLEGLYDPPDAFNIGDNKTLVEPPHTIAQQGGLEWIRTYFQISAPGEDVPTSERYRYSLVVRQLNHGTKKGNSSHSGGSRSSRRSHQLKLLVVGRDDAGKTSVIAKLRDAQSHHPARSGGSEAGTPNRCFSSEDPPAHHHPPVHPATPLRGAAATASAVTSPPTASGAKESPRSTFELRLPGSATTPTHAADRGPDTAVSPPITGSSRPATPSTCQSNAFTPGPPDTYPASTDQHGKLDCIITPWYPKKAVLDKFILPKTADSRKMDKAAKSLFTVEPDDIKFTIWNFVGKWMFHAVYEMFFSVSALHMVVFDLSKTATENDCDKYVQYWVDLIQARAPGSSFIVVATHADLITAEQERERLHMVKARLHSNEALRIQDLVRDIEYCADPERKEAFRQLLQKRPVIDEDVIALRKSSHEEELHEVLCLSVRIVQLATPTKKVPHPFASINTPLEDFYWNVKESITALRKEKKAFCTLTELNQHIVARSTGSGGHSSKTILSGTRVALAHWSSVGEVRFVLYHSLFVMSLCSFPFLAFPCA